MKIKDRVFLYLAALLMISACSPHIEGIGHIRQTPHLEADAFVMADGYRLPYRAHLPEKQISAILVALHGFNDYANAFSESGKDWAAQGIAVYAYDQRGFGRTEGRGLWHGAKALTSDLATVIDLLRDRYKERKIAVLGESMGGAVIVAGLSNPALRTPQADCVILSAPALWGRAVMPWWQRSALAILSHSLPWLEVAPSLRRTPSDNIEMLRKLSRDPWFIRRTRIDAIHGLVGLMDLAYAGVPGLGEKVLLLYGLKEDILPEAVWRGAVSRLTAGAGWRLALYDSGYHMLTRDLQAGAVIEDIAHFILTPEQTRGDRPGPVPGTSLPSGKEIISHHDLPKWRN